MYVEDTNEMARSVVVLLVNPEYKQRIGNSGLSYARKVHSCVAVAEQLETILEVVIGGKK